MQKDKKIFSTSLFIIVSLFILLFMIIIIWYLLQDPKCGGYFDPKSRWCSQGRLVSNSPIPLECNPQDTLSYIQSMLSFLKYIQQMMEKTNDNTKLTTFLSPLGKTRKGIVLFAIPSLLQIMPSDFGQNYSTPYGIVSFFNEYLPCIQQTDAFCKFISGSNKNEMIPIVCKEYLTKKKS